MENIQLLSNNQIRDIWYIIKRDYVNPLIKKKFDEFYTKEDYIKIYNGVVETEEYKDKLSKIENTYQVNFKAINLINELNKLNYTWTYNPIANWSIKSIEEVYNESIIDLGSETKNIALNILNINNEYHIQNNIEIDIKAVLSLTSVSNVDTIIENAIKYINVDKYFYK